MIGTIQTEKAKEREKDEEKQKNISASGKATSVRGAGGGHGGCAGAIPASGGDAGERSRKRRSGGRYAEKPPHRPGRQHESGAEGDLGLRVVRELSTGGSDTKRRGIYGSGRQPAAGRGRYRVGQRVPCAAKCIRLG